MIVPHAPGTKHGDDAEWNAINRLFGSSGPLIVSNKGIIGHTLGAEGILGIEFAILLLDGKLNGYPRPQTVMPVLAERPSALFYQNDGATFVTSKRAHVSVAQLTLNH